MSLDSVILGEMVSYLLHVFPEPELRLGDQLPHGRIHRSGSRLGLSRHLMNGHQVALDRENGRDLVDGDGLQGVCDA